MTLLLQGRGCADHGGQKALCDSCVAQEGEFDGREAETPLVWASLPIEAWLVRCD